jgi:FKBP-type peptidyl-prolyl cis-trans isomerase SlyD
MATKIKQNTVVRLVYRLTDSDGRLIEDRTPENPFEFLQGLGQVVAPVERAIEGKTAGFRCEVTVSPRDGYGEYDPSLVVEIPQEEFPEGRTIEVGMKFNTMGPRGKPVVVRVIAAEDGVVTVDGNHPLAGLELIFELRVLDVREATETEIETGRIGSGPSETVH